MTCPVCSPQTFPVSPRQHPDHIAIRFGDLPPKGEKLVVRVDGEIVRGGIEMLPGESGYVVALLGNDAKNWIPCECGSGKPALEMRRGNVTVERVSEG
jgi:hypothetical protein